MLKNYFLIFFSVILTISLIEFFFRSNSNILNDKTILNFPPSKIQQKLRIIRRMQISKEHIKFLETSDGGLVNLPNKSRVYPASKTDKFYGVEEEIFFKDGFCNKKKRNQEKLSIISFGDSFTHCFGIKPEQAWAKLIKLNKPINNLENINYGLPGGGLNQYYELMKSKLDKNTKLVIIAIYEGNDLGSAINYEIFKNKTPEEKDEIKFQKIQKIKKPYLMDDVNDNDSVFIRLIKKTFLKLYTANIFYSVFIRCHTKESCKKRFGKNKVNFKYHRVFNEKKQYFNTSNADLNEVELAKKVFKNEINQNKIFDLWQSPIIEMSNLAKKNKSKIIFIYIPSTYSALGNNNVKFNDKKIKEMVFNLSDTQQKVFKKICFKNNLDCLNLVKNFINFNNNSYFPSHFPTNNHLTSEGHKIVARAINNYLNKKK